jgi:hypothetical protein
MKFPAPFKIPVVVTAAGAAAPPPETKKHFFFLKKKPFSKSFFYLDFGFQTSFF